MHMPKITFILGYLLDLLTICSVKCVLLPAVPAATKNRTAKMAAFVSLRNIVLRIFCTTCTQTSTYLSSLFVATLYKRHSYVVCAINLHVSSIRTLAFYHGRLFDN